MAGDERIDRRVAAIQSHQNVSISVHPTIDIIRSVTLLKFAKYCILEHANQGIELLLTLPPAQSIVAFRKAFQRGEDLRLLLRVPIRSEHNRIRVALGSCEIIVQRSKCTIDLAKLLSRVSPYRAYPAQDGERQR